MFQGTETDDVYMFFYKELRKVEGEQLMRYTLEERSFGASQVAQMVKNLPAMQEIRVQSLGREDHLEKGMETHSSILAWRIPWSEEPGRLQSMDSQELDTT